MLAQLRRRIRQWSDDRAGAVAVLYAVAALPLIGVIGIGIDYGFMLSVKSKLDMASDAAAIAGATGANDYITAYTGSSDPTASATAAGQAQAQAQFNANRGGLPNGTITFNPPTITRSGSTITSAVSYSFSMPTLFMAVLGTKTMTVTGGSAASVTLPTYVNIFIILDNSEIDGHRRDVSRPDQDQYGQSRLRRRLPFQGTGHGDASARDRRHPAHRRRESRDLLSVEKCYFRLHLPGFHLHDE